MHGPGGAAVSKQKLRFTVADTETTGLCGDPPNVDEALKLDRQIIEYAFVVWEEGHILKRFQRKVMPTGDALADAEECARKGWNHFSHRDWLNPVGNREYGLAKPWAKSDCENVFDFLDGETMAGSNPDFDLVMFKAEFVRMGLSGAFPQLVTHRKLDVGKLAWPLWSVKLVEKTGLEPLTKFLGIEHKAHTAMGDCEAVVTVFEELCDQYIHVPRRLRDLVLAACEGLDHDDADTLKAELAKLRVL